MQILPSTFLFFFFFFFCFVKHETRTFFLGGDKRYLLYIWKALCYGNYHSNVGGCTKCLLRFREFGDKIFNSGGQFGFLQNNCEWRKNKRQKDVLLFLKRRLVCGWVCGYLAYFLYTWFSSQANEGSTPRFGLRRTARTLSLRLTTRKLHFTEVRGWENRGSMLSRTMCLSFTPHCRMHMWENYATEQDLEGEKECRREVAQKLK